MSSPKQKLVTYGSAAALYWAVAGLSIWYGAPVALAATAVITLALLAYRLTRTG